LTPLVSILVPACNHEAYVAAAIRSVLAQDYPRIELLVVDDGSRDGTPEALRALRAACERRCERVEMAFQANAGTCRTVNRLLDMACGDFCLVMASDDLLAPGALTALVRPMLEDTDVGVVVGENALVDDKGERCYWDANRQAVADAERAAFTTLNAYIAASAGIDRFGSEFGSYAALLRANHIANGCLIRKAALDRIARLTPEAPLEDYWLHLQLAKVTRYRSIRDVTFFYRWHATNASKAVGRMIAMTRLTLEHEAARFRDSLSEERRNALDRVLSLWRKRLLAFVPDTWDASPLESRRLGVPVDVVKIGSGEAALNAALSAADLRGYGFVAYLADAEFLPDGAACRRLMRCLSSGKARVVAGRESFAARAEDARTTAGDAAAIRSLPGPGFWWRLANGLRGRFR